LLTLLVRRRKAGRSITLLLPTAIYLVISMTSRYQLGIRHLLPILPLIYLFISLQLARGRLIGILAGAIVVAGIETAMIHPDYLAFFNAASGGPSRGEKYLIDSNLDWGQDIGRLASWLRTNSRGREYSIRVFNATDALLRELQLDPNALRAAPRGLFAISKNVKHRLDGARQNPDGSVTLGPDYSSLEKNSLVRHIGYSIDVYDLDK